MSDLPDEPTGSLEEAGAEAQAGSEDKARSWAMLPKVLNFRHALFLTSEFSCSSGIAEIGG